MRRKQATYTISHCKVLDGAGVPEGTFEAIVSVFGNVDLVGDRVVAGAFKNSLAKWKASGDPIPVIFSHQWDNLDAHTGEVLEAQELMPGDERLPKDLADNGGLYVKGHLDIDEDFGRKLYNRLKRRRIREFSFAYDVVEEAKAKDGANDLIELDIIEVGPTLKGANPSTELVGTKGDAGEKAYVELAGSHEERDRELRQAVGQWGAGQFGASYRSTVWVYVEATFDDRVIVCVDDFRSDAKDSVNYEIPYTLAADGQVALGEAKEVEIVASVQPVATPGKARDAKAGRVLSTRNEGKIADAVMLLQEVLDSVASDDSGKDVPTPSSRSMSPADVRLRTDIIIAEAV